jgi:hypothetical protein
MSTIPRTELQHLHDFLGMAAKSSDSIVAIQAVCLKRRLEAIEREKSQHLEAELTRRIEAERQSWLGAF